MELEANFVTEDACRAYLALLRWLSFPKIPYGFKWRMLGPRMK
jgi:hypothetical protein